MNIFDALSSYLPKSELIIISSDTYNIENGLGNVIKQTQKQGELVKAILLSMTKPIIFILAIIGMMYFSAVKLMPSLNASIPADKMPEITLKFSHFNQYMLEHVTMISLVIAIISALIVLIIPRRKDNLRQFLDYIPPFSIYKKICTVKFLVSISLLLNSHKKQSKGNIQASLRFCLLSVKNNANAYISSYVNNMIRHLDEGESPGETLIKTGFFDRDISALVCIYSDAGKLSEGIYDLAVNYFDEQITKIKKSFQAISGVFFFAMAAYMAFFIMSLQALGSISA